jgi:uncharacterized protein
MSDREQRPPGPYHPGELEVQRRAGVSEDAERVGEIIGDALPPTVGRFLVEQRLAVAASVDGDGRVWASLLTGSPGFIRAVDAEHLLVESRLAPADPLARNLAVRPELGLLVIDLARRRRLRVNGRGVRDGNRISLAVQQAYGNCPKYIKPRRVEPLPQAASSDRQSTALDAGQQAWIAGADSFFIASYHPQGGADASHRGGPPGFVSVHGPKSLSFPDYPGNNMFNTLGNIAAQPRVGLLFLDFEAGGTLQLTGRASLDWHPDEAAPGAGAGRAVVSFELDLALETHGHGVIARTVGGDRDDTKKR